MNYFKNNALVGVSLLLFSLSAQASCISLDNPRVEIQGELSAVVKLHDRQFYVLQTSANWCAPEENQDQILTAVYVPEFFIPDHNQRLIDEQVVQGPVFVTGQLKKGPKLDGEMTYQIKPESIFVSVLRIDLLESSQSPPPPPMMGQDKPVEPIDPEDPNFWQNIEPAAGGDDPSTTLSGFPAFPDRVPSPSKRTQLRLFTQDAIDSGTLNLGDAENKLRQALADGGYEELAYYSFDRGFAIATTLEQTDHEANPLHENRWMIDVRQSNVFDLNSFLRALFLADKGYFRVLVFIVNDRPLKFGEEVDKQALRDVIAEGSDRLPAELRKRLFNPQMKCTALVYEFEHDENSRSIINKKPGRHSVNRHLTSTNTKQSLDRLDL